MSENRDYRTHVEGEMALIGHDMTGWNDGAKNGGYARDTLARPNELAPENWVFHGPDGEDYPSLSALTQSLMGNGKSEGKPSQ